jgi:RNA polymerase sigma-70 factor, ECF subfamily
VSPAPKTEPNEDDELMIQLQSGDQTAFETLVDKYRAPLEGFFHKNLRDRQLAEDLTQETLLKVYNVAWDYLPLGRFRGWMYRIAKNLMIDKIRRRTNDVLILARKTRPSDEDFDPLNWIAGDRLPPEEIASHQELADTVDELLLEIPEEQRLTFTLHHYSGVSLPEVAEIMESNLPTTKSRLRLAREKLSSQLNSRGVHLNLEQTDEN